MERHLSDYCVNRDVGHQFRVSDHSKLLLNFAQQIPQRGKSWNDSLVSRTIGQGTSAILFCPRRKRR